MEETIRKRRRLVEDSVAGEAISDTQTLSDDINADDAVQYDRQIRLWGLDAQKRLRQARILMIGARGLSAEVCKNIVLAGIASLTLLDHQSVTISDLTAQFFLSPESIGKNLAEATAPALQKLNPKVKINVDVGKAAEKSKGYFSNFDLVVCTGLPLYQCAEINAKCRACNNVRFFCGEVLGFYGYFFADLLEHKFSEEHEQEVKGEKKNICMQSALSYLPLGTVLGTSWNNYKFKKDSPKTLLGFIVISAYHKQYGTYPGKNDLEALEVTLKTTLNAVQCPLSELTLDDLTKLAAGTSCELGLVSAIVGGMLAGEIIKSISCKDRPLENFFVFDGCVRTGKMMRVRPLNNHAAPVAMSAANAVIIDLDSD